MLLKPRSLDERFLGHNHSLNSIAWKQDRDKIGYWLHKNLSGSLQNSLEFPCNPFVWMLYVDKCFKIEFQREALNQNQKTANSSSLMVEKYNYQNYEKGRENAICILLFAFLFTFYLLKGWEKQLMVLRDKN